MGLPKYEVYSTVRQLAGLSEQAKNMFGDVIREALSLAVRVDSHIRILDRLLASKNKLDPYREDCGKDGMKSHEDPDHGCGLRTLETLKDTEKPMHDKKPRRPKAEGGGGCRHKKTVLKKSVKTQTRGRRSNQKSLPPPPKPNPVSIINLPVPSSCVSPAPPLPSLPDPPASAGDGHGQQKISPYNREAYSTGTKITSVTVGHVPRYEPRSDLLKAIRDGVQLKKVENVKPKQGEKNITWILARRMASVQMSDSDSVSGSEYYSDGWAE